MKKLVLFSVVALGFTACGSSDGVAATATKGYAFCTLAQTAADDNDTLDALDFTDSAKVRLDLPAAIDSLSAAVAKAPKDIATDSGKLLTMEESIETLLKANDFDVVKMNATDEGKKAFDDLNKSPIPKEFDKYLTDKCGIARPSTTDDTTPADGTLGTGDTSAPSDTIATDDTSVTDDTGSDISIELGEGADAINKFLDFYELGTSSTLSDTDRSCIVDNLVDKVTGDELNEAIAGNPSDALSLALGQAFITCNVSPQS